MGKISLDVTKLIHNTTKRRVIYAKRQRSLIKKAIELSVMCDQEISLTIFDKKK